MKNRDSSEQAFSVEQLSTLENLRMRKKDTIPLPRSSGFEAVDGYFIGKIKDKWVAYDNVCDHNGGLLCLDKDKRTATCSIHKWKLLLNESKYENGCQKRRLEVEQGPDSLTIEKIEESFPRIETEGLYDGPMNFNFNAHASVSVSINSFRIITDPWLLGSCFATGWWHAFPPSQEALDRLRNCDLIYVSHNHPDHLHLPTLAKCVGKDKKFLVPNFESKSVESILRREGYNNLIVADFLQEIVIQTGDGKIKLMVVKSGDDRDDSSLLVWTRSNSAFFGVDTNMPNKWVLPQVDILFTPFASGASGFPSRIENFSTSEKTEIIAANRATMLSNHVRKLIRATNPKYVAPYAGYFAETHRDRDVREINKKNSAQDLVNFAESEFDSVRGINLPNTPSFSIYRDQLMMRDSHETPAYFVDEDYVLEDIKNFTRNSRLVDHNFLDDLGKRFVASKFEDSLTVVIIPSNDDFSPYGEYLLTMDFSAANRKYGIQKITQDSNEKISEQVKHLSGNRVEILRVRKDSLTGVISKGLPLEDLSIGFQIKMFREPNVYNFKFWNHFTNNEFVSLPTS